MTVMDHIQEIWLVPDKMFVEWIEAFHEKFIPLICICFSHLSRSPIRYHKHFENKSLCLLLLGIHHKLCVSQKLKYFIHYSLKKSLVRSLIHHLQVVGLCVSYSTCLSLSFFIYKMWIIAVTELINEDRRSSYEHFEHMVNKH